jgi:glycine/D-amino acid oxidase-like deaminating enzyme
VSPGPSIGALDSITQFKLTEEVGYHFGGGASGLALALSLQQAYGTDVVLFETGPRLLYDFQVGRALGLYISPSLLLGYALQSSKYSDSEHGVTVQLACDAKLTLADRAFVFFRPVGIDVLHLRWRGMGHTGVRYELLIGAGATY